MRDNPRNLLLAEALVHAQRAYDSEEEVRVMYDLLGCGRSTRFLVLMESKKAMPVGKLQGEMQRLARAEEVAQSDKLLDDIREGMKKKYRAKKGVEMSDEEVR